MTRFHTTGLVAAALLAFAAPAGAANSNTNSNANNNASRQGEEAQRQGDSDRQICVRVELSNSRIARRVCKTPEEWEAQGGVPTADR